MPKKTKKKVTTRAKARVVVFSGVRSIQMAQFPYIDAVLDALKAKVFISGGAYGIDTYCCTEAVRRFPKATHYVVVPYNYGKNDVHIAWCMQQAADGIDMNVLDMPKPPNRSQAPEIFRNEHMIKMAMRTAKALDTEAILVAFPGGPTELQRSGTWTTVRRARAAGMRVYLHPLSEAEGQIIAGEIEA